MILEKRFLHGVPVVKKLPYFFGNFIKCRDRESTHELCLHIGNASALMTAMSDSAAAESEPSSRTFVCMRSANLFARGLVWSWRKRVGLKCGVWRYGEICLAGSSSHLVCVFFTVRTLIRTRFYSRQSLKNSNNWKAKFYFNKLGWALRHFLSLGKISITWAFYD